MMIYNLNRITHLKREADPSPLYFLLGAAASAPLDQSIASAELLMGELKTFPAKISWLQTKLKCRKRRLSSGAVIVNSLILSPVENNVDARGFKFKRRQSAATAPATRT